VQKISYQFDQSIWKVLPFSKGRLLLELRDKQKYTASWKIIDTDTEHVHFSHEIKKDSWWYNSIETSPPYFFLHQLRQGKTPEIVNLKVIDTSKQEQSEDYKSSTLNEITPEGFIKTDDSGEPERITLDNLTHNKSSCVTSTLYTESSEHFVNFKEAIKNYTNKEAVRQCEYIETEKLVAFSFFFEEKNNLSCHLLVLNTEGFVLLHEEMANSLDGVFTESFTLIDNKIIYIKNDNEIHILD